MHRLEYDQPTSLELGTDVDYLGLQHFGKSKTLTYYKEETCVGRIIYRDVAKQKPDLHEPFKSSLVTSIPLKSNRFFLVFAFAYSLLSSSFVS
ncbi:unnamed protein product [Trichobilharzia regenti]|nr:unnamed protein product [Trichobilharzia regenti]